MTDLFTSYSLGGLTLANRLVMASMTRNHASEQSMTGALMATYCAQRSGAGLLISESTHEARG